MAITLKQLSVHGPELLPAKVVFDGSRTLIRGPSETGKSHIWKCIWFLLGGTGTPEPFPELQGYNSLELAFLHGEHEYVVRKAMSGGAARVQMRMSNLWVPDGTPNPLEDVDEDLGELLVRLSGAAGKLVLRKRSEKGPLTGDDLRHWALLSQPGMISEDATKGKGHGSDKHVSSYSLFLSGLDDSAVDLYKTASEKDQAKGRLAAAEAELARLQGIIPAGTDRASTVAALAQVDERLDMFATQLQVRSSVLKELRQQIFAEGDALTIETTQLASATSMRERFMLLDLKYASDLARLGATDEGIAFFQALAETPCPLCGTPVEQHVDPDNLNPRAPTRYRDAIAAEAEKIRALRRGLQPSLAQEQMRLTSAAADVQRLTASLKALEEQEKAVLRSSSLEFDSDPRDLAESHTRFSSLIDAFDEAVRLTGEIARLKDATKQKQTALVRNVGQHGEEVGTIARQMLNDWGFTSIQSVYVDPKACDLVIDGRRRLSYGAGKRGLFLSAMTIALMQHALRSDHPHLGVVVLDSPLKAYAQKETPDNDREIPAATVNTSFYTWLSRFQGPGQIVVLENEAVDPVTASALHAIEFTDDYTRGRQGFYPPRPKIAQPGPSDGAEFDKLA
ncbi:hypothetical protein [Xanthomonas arboricola]|uniref:hypothetical protein n=1 Tax=Xanthomonas arboricola TaxID=56448 RepID=UPI000CED9F50|nr:hypothetical protein [Xanthomonas arboricola]MBB6575382.1 hypothetical protein [Xanthomonas arboricola]PPT86642.1 hypothetical protein XarbCFBP8149_16240 [Xanthomonas arboricola]